MERKINQYIKEDKIYKDQPIEPIRIETQTVILAASDVDNMKSFLDGLVEDIINQENLMDFSGKEVTIIEPVRVEISQIADKFHLKAYEIIGIIIPKE